MKQFIAAILFVLAIGPIAASAQPAATTNAPIKIEERLKFTVRDANGNDVKFSDLLGKGPVLVNFWALWCEPCKQEMKAFKGIVEKFKEKGVSMVAVNTDKVKSMSKVRAYVTTQELPFPVLLDPDGSIARDIFAMESLPYSLILNPDGTIYKKHIGYTAGDEAAVEKEVDELLLKLTKTGS